jgi:hypothetical protein
VTRILRRKEDGEKKRRKGEKKKKIEYLRCRNVICERKSVNHAG